VSKHLVEIDKLERFNNRAREMMGSTFIRFLNDRTMTLRIREGVDKNMVVETELPDKESIKAFVPDFRLIYMHSRYDKFSLADLNELYGKLKISGLLRERFCRTYTMLNEFLDKPIGLTVNNETPTNRKLFDVFIYGYYLHETQFRTYQRWTKQMSKPKYFSSNFAARSVLS
jgi:hypothetical protein